MMAALKIISTIMLLQQLINTVNANFTIAPQKLVGIYMQVSGIAFNTSVGYVVAEVTDNPTRWIIDNPLLLDHPRIATIDGLYTLFADDTKVGNKRPVYTWTNRTRQPEKESDLWDLEQVINQDKSSLRIYYIRNVKHNEYLCVDANATKVNDTPSVFTMPRSHKEACGKWNFVGNFESE